MTGVAVLEDRSDRAPDQAFATERESVGHQPGRDPARRALGHEDLLTLARKVRAAAEDGDGPRLRRVSERFRTELERHLSSEDHDLGALPDPQRCELAAGQQKLRELASALAAVDPACLGVSRTRPARLMVGLLAYQRENERRVLARWAGSHG